MAGKLMNAQREGTCHRCQGKIAVGQRMFYMPPWRQYRAKCFHLKVQCPACPEYDPENLTEATAPVPVGANVDLDAVAAAGTAAGSDAEWEAIARDIDTKGLEAVEEEHGHQAIDRTLFDS